MEVSSAPVSGLPVSVAILGAGSLGLAYAAALAAAGHRVQVLTRPRHAEAIRSHGGLRIQGAFGSATVAVAATSHPRDLIDAALVILACKAPDTPALLASTLHLTPGVRAAFSVQNGVEKDAWLADWASPEVVVGAVSMIGASEVAGGVVAVTMGGVTYLGPHASTSPDALDLCSNIVRNSALPTEVVSDIARVEWSKLAQAVAGMAAAALSRMYWHDVLLDADLSLLLVQLVLEVNLVAAARGIALIDLAGLLPVATLATKTASDGRREVQELGWQLVNLGATEVKTSMLQSIEKARHIEVETLMGFVYREGSRLGLELPRTETCYRLLAAIDRHLG
jgi:2-dehydropantoate 2-reductase